MKYMLDIVLVLALCWLGWAWNGEKQNGLALSDQIDGLNAKVAQLQLDLSAAADAGTKAAAELETAKAQLEQSGKDLTAQTEALTAKSKVMKGSLAHGLRSMPEACHWSASRLA